tara:strand:- start:102 stop:362 length:261 start_codon:yes stop_codon:yes gene_type:complete
MERTAQVVFSVSEVWVNEDFVVSVRPAPAYRKLLAEGRIQGNLHKQHEFTAITTNNGNAKETHVVIGEVNEVARRLNRDHRELLKG